MELLRSFPPELEQMLGNIFEYVLFFAVPVALVMLKARAVACG